MLSSVPISLLRQHIFCPRIPFFNEVKQINPGDRPWQSQGVTFHQRQSMLTKRRNLSRFGLARGEVQLSQKLKSTQLQCHGICDSIILTDNEVAIIEFKLAGKKPTKGQMLQAAAYGMVAEQQYNRPCKRIFVLIGERGKTYHYPLNKGLRSKVVQALREVQFNLTQPILPHSAATEHQCGQCEYLNFCGDR